MLSSKVSEAHSDRRSRGSSCNSFKSGDEEDEGLKDIFKLRLDNKDNSDKEVYELVNAFEANFYESIDIELVQ